MNAIVRIIYIVTVLAPGLGSAEEVSLVAACGSTPEECDEALAEDQTVSLLQGRLQNIRMHKSECKPRPEIPPPPKKALDYNGISWPEMCFVGNEEEHVFLIGDWGGLVSKNTSKVADNTRNKREFVWGIDEKAGLLVADEFNKLAAISRPRYVLNAGDNFYWAGLNEKCGRDVAESLERFKDATTGNAKQFNYIYENVYKGAGVDGVPWLSTLGNHDYGGYEFDHAWDQQIAYTWGPSNRWVMPGQYYHQHVEYPTKGFSIDYYAVDTNNQDTNDPQIDPMHNICSAQHNGGHTCASIGGPSDPYHCVKWFKKLWQDQLNWLDQKLAESTADWQIIVTHFPPETWTHYGQNVEDWKKLGDKYGIDLIVAAHRHDQELRDKNDPLVRHRSRIPYVVTGGGGGVTSEKMPSNGDGVGSRQYGFFDMVVSKEALKIQGYNHIGKKILYMEVAPRPKQCTITDGSAEPAFYPCLCGGFEVCDAAPLLCTTETYSKYSTAICAPPTTTTTTLLGCWGMLDGVALDEGGGAGNPRKVTLDECKVGCTLLPTCQSIIYKESTKDCWPKNKILKDDEPTRPNNLLKSHYMHVDSGLCPSKQNVNRKNHRPHRYGMEVDVPPVHYDDASVENARWTQEDYESEEFAT